MKLIEWEVSEDSYQEQINIPIIFLILKIIHL